MESLILSEIAVRHNTSVRKILRYNKMSSSTIRVDFDWDKDRFVEYRSPLQRKKTLLFGSKSSLEYNTSVIDNQQKLKVRFTVGTEIVIWYKIWVLKYTNTIFFLLK